MLPGLLQLRQQRVRPVCAGRVLHLLVSGLRAGQGPCGHGLLPQRLTGRGRLCLFACGSCAELRNRLPRGGCGRTCAPNRQLLERGGCQCAGGAAERRQRGVERDGLGQVRGARDFRRLARVGRGRGRAGRCVNAGGGARCGRTGCGDSRMGNRRIRDNSCRQREHWVLGRHWNRRELQPPDRGRCKSLERRDRCGRRAEQPHSACVASRRRHNTCGKQQRVLRRHGRWRELQRPDCSRRDSLERRGCRGRLGQQSHPACHASRRRHIACGRQRSICICRRNGHRRELQQPDRRCRHFVKRGDRCGRFRQQPHPAGDASWRRHNACGRKYGPEFRRRHWRGRKLPRPDRSRRGALERQYRRGGLVQQPHPARVLPRRRRHDARGQR